MTVAVEIDDRIEKCRKILELDPNSQIFAALAEAYRKKGELDKAFRVCQSGLKVHPSYGAAHVVMAKINLDRQLFDWAEAEVQKAMELDGRSRAIELLLAEIFLYKGEYDQATKLLKTLHQSDPDNGQIKRLLDIARQIPAEEAASKRVQVREVAVPAMVSPGPAAVSDSASRGHDNGGGLDRAGVIREARRTPGLKGAMFINGEGLVAESDWAAAMDATVCGAELAATLSFVNGALLSTTFGSVQSVFIEARRHIFYLLAVEHGAFLFVGDADMNLGSLRMCVAALMERYQPA